MKKQVFRMILMITGILTVAIILLSQSFYGPVQNSPSKNKAARTEQSKKERRAEDQKKIIINAPADVVASQAVQLDENTPILLKTLTPDQEQTKTAFPEIKIFASYFRVLFRSIISPNAP
jgi:hypothetical protein